ncbi:hypothetical protein KKA14_10935 [bacterium]|nr:hypothetical protein [bacterium]
MSQAIGRVNDQKSAEAIEKQGNIGSIRFADTNRLRVYASLTPLIAGTF